MQHNYFHETVSTDAVNAFLTETTKHNINIIAMEIFEKNELMLRYAPEPFSCFQKAEVYSMSKTFTSVAVGIAIDKGLFSIEDTVIDFFPDKCPPEPSAHLKALKVKHLLSMNTGHTDGYFPAYETSQDPIRYFFNLPQPYAPGTYFFYDSGASFMLSAIITKVTGLSLLDFANIHFLHDMGIYPTQWRKMCGMYNAGASELNISCDDIAKLGLLFLGNGVYQGKRYVSETWMRLATSAHSDNSRNDTPDWQAGYGFQVWMNHEEGYRGVGAHGQFMLVLPEQEIVVAVRAESQNEPKQLDLMKSLVQQLHHVDAPEQQVAIPTSCPVLPPKELDFSYENITFKLEKNPIGATFLHLNKEADALHISLSTSEKMIHIYAGNGCYLDSAFTASMMRPAFAWHYIGTAEEQVHYACCYNIEDDVIDVLVKSLNSPHSGHIQFAFDAMNGRIRMKFMFQNNALSEGLSELVGVAYQG